MSHVLEFFLATFVPKVIDIISSVPIVIKNMSEYLTLNNILLGAVCIGIATVAVLYFTGKITVHCGASKSGYTYATPNSGCEYLAETVQDSPHAAEINALCSQYQEACGNASVTAELLGLDLSPLDPNDPDGAFISALQQDVLDVKLDSSKCSPLLKCDVSKQIDCPSFLQCKSGVCA